MCDDYKVILKNLKKKNLNSKIDLLLFEFSDGCNPLIYRVLDDHRRSILYRPSPTEENGNGNSAATASSLASNANNRYNVDDTDYDEDAALDIAFVPQNELLCDDVLPYGWYRFLTYGM